MIAPSRPVQRVGHIGDDDNRFCGASVFTELAPRGDGAVELLALAVGAPRLTAIDREALRCVALCTTSPDARVWPLKLARTLASYGNPVAGCYGAQLGNASRSMGPGTATGAATSLVWLRERVGDEPDRAALTDAVVAHQRERGRILGFGVPFRKEDERLLAMHRFLADHPTTRRPTWRLHTQVIEVMRALHGLEPNVVFPSAALFTDLGVPPHRAGMLLSMIMGHNFAAHAIEAAEQDGPWLQELPSSAIDDHSRAPRRSPAAEATAALTAGSVATAPRRSLAW
jgi:hypothetical protein